MHWTLFECVRAPIANFREKFPKGKSYWTMRKEREKQKFMKIELLRSGNAFIKLGLYLSLCVCMCCCMWWLQGMGSTSFLLNWWNKEKKRERQIIIVMRFFFYCYFDIVIYDWMILWVVSTSLCVCTAFFYLSGISCFFASCTIKTK